MFRFLPFLADVLRQQRDRTQIVSSCDDGVIYTVLVRRIPCDRLLLELDGGKQVIAPAWNILFLLDRPAFLARSTSRSVALNVALGPSVTSLALLENSTCLLASRGLFDVLSLRLAGIVINTEVGDIPLVGVLKLELRLPGRYALYLLHLVIYRFDLPKLKSWIVGLCIV